MNRLALLAAFSLATPAVAGVVSRDLFEPGDKLLTYDDVNQRDWLDFSVTRGLTQSELEFLLTSDKRLHGFMPGDYGALLELFQSGGNVSIPGEGDTPYYEPGAPNGQPLGTNWMELLGGRFQVDRWPYLGGLVSASDAISRPVVLLGPVDAFDTSIYRLLAFSLDTGESFRELGTFTVADTSAFESAGANYWLYRDAVAVPEPAAGWLALAACFGALRLRGFA